MIRAERGSVLVFILAAVVPLFFALSSIALDVSRTTLKLSAFQADLDTVALHCAKYLPDLTKVDEAARQEWRALGHTQELQVEVQEDIVKLQSSSRLVPTFASFFEQFDENYFISLPARSSARIIPNDAALILDRGSNGAPDIFSSGDQGWGDPREWAPATLFSDEVFPQKNGIAVNARIATGHCFNPTFSKAKGALLTTLRHLDSFALNKIGLFDAPGALGEVGIVKEISFKSSALPPKILDTHIDWNVDRYEYAEEPELDAFPVKSIFCAAIADEELRSEISHYKFPEWIAGVGAPLVNHTEWSVFDGYPLSFEKVIWSKSIHTERKMDLRLVLSSLRGYLFMQAPERRRGGLARQTRKLALIFSPNIPSVAGTSLFTLSSSEQNLLQDEIVLFASVCAASKTSCELSYFLFNGDAPSADAIQSQFDQLLIDNELKRFFKIKVFFNADTKILSAALSGGQYAVLAS